jgi:fumarate reductase subunit C
MANSNEFIDDATLSKTLKKSRMPARLDFLQSFTGLLLAIFMWGHMVFVSSILLGKDAMYTITKMFEGEFIFGKPYPIIVSFAVAIVFTLFILHAFLAMRKFPINYYQYKTYRSHMHMMHHKDTNLWFIQAYTGFAMFFLGSVHLYIMLTNPEKIGPYGSADRVVSDWMWPLYILLLLAVELHGSIGLYRLAVKWGWFEGRNAKESRKKLKRGKIYVTVFFLALGVLSLAAYIKIGIEHRANYGEKYQPTTMHKQEQESLTQGGKP